MGEAVEGTGSDGSLSEHEAQYHRSAQLPLEDAGENPEPAVSKAEAKEAPQDGGTWNGLDDEEKETQKEGRARAKDGTFTKHRAQSQKASPEDVPRIKELTKNWREEQEKRQALEARLADYERRLAGNSAPSQSQPVKESAREAFGDKEPTIEQFANEADPYAAWIRAVNRYDRKKEAFETEQERVAADRKRVEAEGQEYLVRKSQEYKAKVDEFSAANPDFNDLMVQFEDWDLPPLAGATILEHSNGPQLVYNLMKQPEELAGLILLTDGKPVNEKTVALATRWLEKRALDVKTGSSAPVVQRKPTPTPPNPVRTVPSGSADSDDEVESMSLSSFEKKFHKGRR